LKTVQWWCHLSFVNVNHCNLWIWGNHTSYTVIKHMKESLEVISLFFDIENKYDVKLLWLALCTQSCQNCTTCLHSVTTKFPNRHFYRNNTNAIYQGWMGIEGMFICGMCEFQLITCLVDACEDYN
jgi:hypothetical protein